MGIITAVLFAVLLVECCIFVGKRIEEVYPILLCLLILCLQILGMIRYLSYIVLPISISCILLGVLIYKRGKKQGNALLYVKVKSKKCVFTFGTLLIIETTIMCIVLQLGRSVGTYDEFNFWATAVKSLWHYDGFAIAKDMWAIWEYPQAMPLFQWFGIYIYGEYAEPILYIMRLIFDFSFLIALLPDLKLKWYWSPFVSIIIFIFPSVVNATSYMTLSVDGDLAILFGYVLCCIINRYKENAYYYIRIMLVLSVIVLTKSLSIIWVAYAILFLLMMEVYTNKKNGYKIFDLRLLKKYGFIGLDILVPLLVLKSWSVFLTITGSKSLHVSARAASALPLIIKGEWVWSGYERNIFFAFIKSFFIRPASYVAGGINGILSPFLLCVFIILLLHFITKTGGIDKKLSFILYLYWGVVYLSYSIVFIITLCTVFVGEIQKYSKLNAMALACGRYCGPMFLGSFIVVCYCILRTVANQEIEVRTREVLGTFLIGFILICCNISAISGVCWFDSSKRQTAEERAAEAHEKMETLFAWTDFLGESNNKKKVYVLNNHTIDLQYIYELYPIILQNSFLSDIYTLGDLQSYLYEWDFEYIYYEEELENSNIVNMCNEMLDEDITLDVGGLYMIDMSGVNFKLQKLN